MDSPDTTQTQSELYENCNEIFPTKKSLGNHQKNNSEYYGQDAFYHSREIR